MKYKKFLGIITFAAIATVAGWNYQKNKQNVVLSDLALENVEALARSETDWGNCSFYGCIAYFEYTCNVYSRIWGNLIMVCPNMRA